MSKINAKDKRTVAIVMPVHNAEKFLKKTIQCILDQSYSNWELFAIEDGSKDSSLSILNKFTDPRIKVFSTADKVVLSTNESGLIVASEKENTGPAATRNRALDAIRNSKDYDYIAFCDSDDRWKQNHLEVALKNIIGYDMVYSDCDFVLENGSPAVTYGVPYYEKFERTNLNKQNFIYISTVVMSVDCLKAGNFDPLCVPMEDYDMWLRISRSFNIKHVPTITATYMYKAGGSYYTNEQSMRAQGIVHIKNSIISSDINTLQIQLQEIKNAKMELVKIQKYEEVARLRDLEKQIEQNILDKTGPQTIQGWLSTVEGEALATYGEGKDCLEIGSFKGKSANYIAPKANSLVCIDPFRADESGQNQFIDYTTLQEFLKNTSRFKNIIPVIGKSEDVHSQFKDGQFEMIFIDGMHDYDSVVNDIKNYWPKLKMGGHMCFHDYQKDWNGVIQAVDEFFIKPDELYDSIAVVLKKSEELEKKSEESITLKEQLENKMLLMKYLHLSLEDIDKMDFYRFEECVKLVKEKILSLDTPVTPDRDTPAITPDRVIKKVVVVCPFSRNLPTGEENPKNFPYWEELVQQMKDSGCYVIQIGVAGEKLIGADEIVFNASNERLLEVLNNCDTFISIDSFFPHFAHYHGKHGIVIFSQSDPKLFGYEENLNILKSRDYLRKEQFWLWTQAKFNKDAFISSKSVLDKVLEILQLK